MTLNKQNKANWTRKPIQASDYGQPALKTCKNDDKAKISDTDGRKTLALWS